MPEKEKRFFKEEIGAHAGTPCGHREKMQTPHRKALSLTPPQGVGTVDLEE